MADYYDIKDLEYWDAKIREKVEEFGLSCYPQEFEICDHFQMLGYLAYSGMPSHYPHWSYGKAYEKLKTLYDYGVSGLPYEMVITSNPALAYLMRDNTLTLQILTIAHVYGHNDFFKNNFTYKPTRAELVLSTFKARADRVRSYIEDPSVGLEKVEAVLDAAHALSLQCRRNLAIRKLSPAEQRERALEAAHPSADPFQRIHKRPGYVEPDLHKVPLSPEEDILLFIRDYNPHFSEWQKDLLTIVHEEAQYFIPLIETKIMNEGWACATGDTLIFTERGLMRFDELYAARHELRVTSGNGRSGLVIDFHRETDVPTLRIVTQRGYEIEGALRHRLRRADGSWAYLHELRCGERVMIDVGSNLWPQAPVVLDYRPVDPHPTLAAVAASVGVSLYTVLRHRQGRRVLRASDIDAALVRIGYRAVPQGRILAVRRPLNLPPVLEERLAYLLGYFIGDGHITKSGIGLTCGEREYAYTLATDLESVTGVPVSIRWDATSRQGRARIELHSREVKALLAFLGVDLEAKAKGKIIPHMVLRSPRSVVSAFLRGYFDADAYAGKEGIILVTASRELVRQVQVLLLNYGILATKRLAQDGTYRLHITGLSARRFATEIGFGLPRKGDALKHYLDSHRWYKEEEFADEIVSIERSRADVFDITVANEHTYVGNGFVNHNSYWHREILNSLNLPQDLHLEFLVHHNQVVRPVPRGLNPYYLGLKIWDDIRRRYDEPTPEEIEKYGKPDKSGRDKLFEVREVDRDISFLRRFLTEELMQEMDMFRYEPRGEDLVITKVSDRENWREVKETLLKNVGMGSAPVIKIEDADYGHNRLLYLKHYHDGRDLQLEYAEKTLAYLHQLWGREVVLETAVNGKKVLLSYSDKGLSTKPLK